MTGLASDLNLAISTITRQPSPRWAAPETMNNALPPSYQSDVWSFGMTMLEVLTGKLPYYGIDRNEQVILQATSKGLKPKRPKMDACKGRISDECWQLMQDCWKSVPASRPGMKEVHRRVVELAKWWETKMLTPEQEAIMTMHRHIGITN